MSNIVKHQQQNAPLNLFDPQQFEAIQRMAKMFSSSELVPDMYKVTATNTIEKASANCIIAIEMAQRTGASILMVMQNLILVHGRPSWSAKFLIATVNTCGKYENLKYRFTEGEKIGKVDEYVLQYDQITKKKTPVKVGIKDYGDLRDIECVAYTCERGSDEILESSPVSIRMAIDEGWFEKNGSKWRTMPKKMLIYRAASFWTNEHAPEISMGMYTTEEVEEITMDIEHEDVTEKVNKQASYNAGSQTIVMPAKEEKEAPKQDIKEEIKVTEKALSDLGKPEEDKPDFA